MTTTATTTTTNEWSGSCDPCDPANYWIDDDTGERVDAITNERTAHDCPGLNADGSVKEGWG
jgi:hypothetical protein